jgi:hypothetical protein
MEAASFVKSICSQVSEWWNIARLGREFLCGGLSVEDGQINDNDREQQKLIHRNMLSCRSSADFCESYVIKYARRTPRNVAK